MKKLLPLLTAVLCAALTSTFSSGSHAAPGDLDAFNPNSDYYSNFYGVATQPDGKILVGGVNSASSSGVTDPSPLSNIIRLNSDGSLDTTFNPNANDYVGGLAVQTDGKILIGGSFTTLQPNGAATATTRSYLARLNSDGSLDTTFNPNPAQGTGGLTMQADGKIVLAGGGYVPQPNGATSNSARRLIARLNSDGSLDNTFDPDPSGTYGLGVSSIALQTDGKIVFSGVFDTLQPNGAANATTRHNIARVNADGSLDTTFNPSANSSVTGYVGGLTGQTDGKIILNGDFSSFYPNGATSATTRIHLARLFNDAAAQRVVVAGATNSATVQLLRSGAEPETQQVTFEVSTNSGTTWTNLTAASRISSGWQVTGYNLPSAAGLIRARVRVSSGRYNGSSSLHEVVAAYPTDNTTPNISVEQPANTQLSPGSSTVDFGESPLAQGGPAKTFTIRNAGFVTLNVGAVTVDGTNAADFIVNTSGTSPSLASGGSTTFAVTFAPTGATSSRRSATLHVASNAPGNNPFNVLLAGLGLSATTSTGNDGLSDHAKYNLSALGFNWQLSQPALVQALYAGAGTAGLYTTAQVQALNVGTPLIQKDASTGQFKLTIAVQQSADLKTYTPLSLSTGTTAINSAGALEFRFYGPSGAQFYRLQSQ